MKSIEDIIEELDGIEKEYEGCAASEKLAGNVVKETMNKGIVVGLRIAKEILHGTKS